MSESLTTSIHRIRLRGPWEWAVPTPIPSQAWTWNRIRLPDEWDRLPELAGPVWFRRRFNAPTGITPTDRIRVALTTVQPPSAVNLNGQTIAASIDAESKLGSVIRYELTSYLSGKNLLEIVFQKGITPSSPESGLGQPLILEIESHAKSMGA